MATEAVVLARESGLASLQPQALIMKAIETGAGIETMERLVALAAEVRAIQAREAWYEAMAEFQRRCPPIKKTRTAKIQTARASYSYSYAPLDEILSTIQPVMGPLGLSVSWRGRVDGEKLIQNCRISHTLGHHEESGDIPMPVTIVDDGRGANPMQRVGIATTYAKRYSLLSIIGMAPEDDPDAEPRNGRQASTDQPEQDQRHVADDCATLVAQVEEKTGSTKGKSWTRYLVTFEDGRSGSTFDARLAQQARLLAGAKVPTVPTLVQSGEYSNLEALSDPTAPDGDAGSAVVIDEKQVRRLSAIASGQKWSDDQVHELLTGYGYNSRKDIATKDYEAIVEKLKKGPAVLKAAPAQQTLA